MILTKLEQFYAFPNTSDSDKTFAIFFLIICDSDPDFDALPEYVVASEVTFTVYLKATYRLRCTLKRKEKDIAMTTTCTKGELPSSP